MVIWNKGYSEPIVSFIFKSTPKSGFHSENMKKKQKCISFDLYRNRGQVMQIDICS